MTQPPSVFFSYASERLPEQVDRLWAIIDSTLDYRFGRQGISVFKADRSIKIGSFFPDKIAQALARSFCFIWVQSPSWFVSDVCREELAIFLERIALLAPRLNVPHPELLQLMIAPVRFRDGYDQGAVPAWIRALSDQMQFSRNHLFRVGEEDKAAHAVANCISDQINGLMQKLEIGALATLSHTVLEQEKWPEWSARIARAALTETAPAPLAQELKPWPTTQMADGLGARDLARAMAGIATHYEASGLARLSLDIPTPSAKNIVSQQKLALYGSSSTPGAGTSAINAVINGITFPRSRASFIAQALDDNTVDNLDFTLVAPPGHGKSIAIAQLVVHLSNTPGHVVLWALGNNVTISQDTHSVISAISALPHLLGAMPRRITIVVDEATLLENMHALDALRSRLNLSRLTAPVSIVMAARDASQSLSDEADTYKLEMSANDHEALYDTLSQSTPVLTRRPHQDAREFLATMPNRRLCGDDVRSCVDAAISHATPVEEFRDGWFLALEEEDPGIRALLSIVACATLFDLPVPLSIAERAANRLFVSADVGGLSGLSPRLHLAGEDYSGLVLRSPYYAASVLRRQGLLTSAHVESSLKTLLDCMGTENVPLSSAELEFARHLIYRIQSTRKFAYPEFEDRDAMAQSLFGRIAGRVGDSLDRVKDGEILARWAGTLSRLPAFRPHDATDASLTELANTVLSLCSRAMARDTHYFGAGYVVLLQAARQFRRLYPASERVRNLIDALLHGDLSAELKRRDAAEAEEHRANEVLHSYALLVRETGTADAAGTRRRLRDLYKESATLFDTKGWRFDAGNLLLQASLVEMRRNDRKPQIERARLLLEAREAALRAQSRHGAWLPLVYLELRRFARLMNMAEEGMGKSALTAVAIRAAVGGA